MDDRWIPAALAAGVPAEQLELHLQPVDALTGGALVGAETFVRWHHPEHGWVPIQRWYDEAARSGALVELALAMLPVWAACTAAHPGIVATFNFSAEQLIDEAFMEAAVRIPDAAGRGLAVEVHHDDFLGATQVGGPDPVTPAVPDLDARLASLRSSGFGIWLDDFGETSLEEVPAGHPSVGVVKLDRSLLAADATWLGGLVRRMHDGGKTILMEGIETHDHLRFAVGAGVDWGQGFLYAPPLPAAAFADHCLAAPVQSAS